MPAPLSPLARRRDQLSATEMAAWTGLLRAHSAVTRKLDRELEAECGLSLAQYDVLVHLSQAPLGQLRMTDLSEQVLLSRSGMTRLVDRLGCLGLVERRSCGSDARVTYAALTDEGHRRLKAAWVVHVRGVREHVTGRLDLQQQENLAAATARLIGVAPDPPDC